MVYTTLFPQNLSLLHIVKKNIFYYTSRCSRGGEQATGPILGQKITAVDDEGFNTYLGCYKIKIVN